MYRCLNELSLQIRRWCGVWLRAGKPSPACRFHPVATRHDADVDKHHSHREEAHEALHALPLGPLHAGRGVVAETEGYRQPGAAEVQGQPAHAEDWLWIQRQDPAPAPQRLQEVRHPQREGARRPAHAQPRVRRRDRPQRFRAEPGSHRGEGGAAEREGHQRRGQGEEGRERVEGRMYILLAWP